jgi:hypothetical protein
MKLIARKIVLFDLFIPSTLEFRPETMLVRSPVDHIKGSIHIRIVSAFILHDYFKNFDPSSLIRQAKSGKSG